MKEKFNEDYFQSGLEKGISLYSHYRWIPELTIPLAYRMIKVLDIKETDSILDYGCAMGYLVKAFRLLGFDAWGYDISEYALDNVPTETVRYIYSGTTWRMKQWDWIICKDVLEHIPYEDIDGLITILKECSNQIFAVIPLGKNGKYNCPKYEEDVTHIIREDIDWWINKFKSHSLEVVKCGNNMPGIKDSWAHHEKANGFFKLKA